MTLIQTSGLKQSQGQIPCPLQVPEVNTLTKHLQKRSLRASPFICSAQVLVVSNVNI